jgi:hypothetical protein
MFVQPPLEDDSAYAAAFTQVLNIWEHDPLVREFVFGSKLAKIAADLLEVCLLSFLAL